MLIVAKHTIFRLLLTILANLSVPKCLYYLVRNSFVMEYLFIVLHSLPHMSRNRKIFGLLKTARGGDV